MEGFIGEVKLFAGDYAPQNWAFCEGQQLPIAQYTPLYSLIGVQFGGDGKNYFNLPDLRGRMVICAGQGIGLTNHIPGDTGGKENIQLTEYTSPQHTHLVRCDTESAGRALVNNPADKLFAKITVGCRYGTNETSNPMMKSDMINTEGQSTAHQNMPPWLCMRYIICLYGYYPVRP